MTPAACPGCGHLRKLHSRHGCVECPCRATYMDLSPRKTDRKA